MELKKDAPKKIILKGDLFGGEIKDLWTDEGEEKILIFYCHAIFNFTEISNFALGYLSY